MLEWTLHALRGVFLLRVSLLTAVFAFAVFPYLARSKARSLLGGLLDVSPFGMGVVTISALACAWTALTTGWLTAANGLARFGVNFGVSGIPSDGWYALSSLLVLFLLFAAVAESHAGGRATGAGLMVGALVGAAIAFGMGLITLALYHWLSPQTKGLGKCLEGYAADITAGFLENGQVVASQFLASVLFAMFLVLYIVLGIAKRLRGSQSTGVPALVYVLLLITLFCWILTLTTFFLDRFHIPTLFILALLTLAGFFLLPWTDHIFKTQPVGAGKAPFPEDVLLAAQRDRVILVAASGGGIQAAAWTARVLTGLELKFRAVGMPNVFARAVRLISSVSGGSVGAMYFSSLYENGALPTDDKEIEKTWRHAAASSLENVSWGLLYGDLLRLVLPVFSWWIDGRGRALEKALLRTKDLTRRLGTKLSDWFTAVADCKRPANIFNTTLVETGDRLLFATTHFHIDDPTTNPASSPKPASRWEFHSFRPGYDVSVVTAARLSAAFPFVSPAARPDIGGPFHPELHVVDGGYYDNDGVASLTEWLDQALSQLQLAGKLEKIKAIMVLTIHGLPDEVQTEPPPGKKTQGWPFQAYAPLQAVFAVRHAAQRANDEILLRLLQEKWAGRVRIEKLPVDYNPTSDVPPPPLSWHLSPVQTEAIQKYWDERNKAFFDPIDRFLRGQDTP